MTEYVSYTQPYPVDIVLNAWGDYDRLRLSATRTNGVTTRKWELLSSRGAPHLVLTPPQVSNALENLFVVNAVRSTDATA